MDNEFIEADTNIMYGQPCIKGTRITVHLILERLSAGEPIEQILRAYPHITKAQVLACIDYAAQLVFTYWDVTTRDKQ